MIINVLFGELAIGQHFYHGSSIDSEHYYKSSPVHAKNRYGTEFDVPETTLVRIVSDYRVVSAQDQLHGNFNRLFVFMTSDESTPIGGVLEYQVGQPLMTTEAVGKCDIGATSIVDVGKTVVVFGSHVFQCNMEIVEDWETNPERVRDDTVVSYLCDLWLMLPDNAITDSQYFVIDGGVA